MDPVLQCAWVNSMTPISRQKDIFGEALRPADLQSSSPSGIHRRGRVLDTADKYEVVVDLKGYNPDNVSILLVDARRALQVKGECAGRNKPGQQEIYKKGNEEDVQATGSFCEKYYLTAGCDPGTLMYDISTDQSRLLITVLKKYRKRGVATFSTMSQGELLPGQYSKRKILPSKSYDTTFKPATNDGTFGTQKPGTVYPNWNQPPVQTANVFTTTGRTIVPAASVTGKAIGTPAIPVPSTIPSWSHLSLPVGSPRSSYYLPSASYTLQPTKSYVYNYNPGASTTDIKSAATRGASATVSTNSPKVQFASNVAVGGKKK